ncbi:unnamed protein product [Peronospora belbahrii]|uniref:Protein kinase domain-containing protein n=1 Tax=Peronospora belbahrii TaxID=622444 RepID=A0ABN8D2D0_9STRA|nr:unnamed protein product [Peronospora belbahrii]
MPLFSTVTDIVSGAADTLTDTTPDDPTPTAISSTETVRASSPAPATRTPSLAAQTSSSAARTPNSVATTPSSAATTPSVTTPETAPVIVEDSAAAVDTPPPVEPSAPASAHKALTTNANSEATSTSAPALNFSSSSSSTFDTEYTPAQASASANASASTTMIITASSLSSDIDDSSGVIVVETGDRGVCTGGVICIVAGSVAAVLLIMGTAFWFYRRKMQKLIIRSSSSNAFYDTGQHTPIANPIILECFTPSSADRHGLNGFDGTVDLVSTANLDSTLHLESSMDTPKSSRSKTSLWEDEAITAARIPMEKLIRKEKINEGGYGVVYRGLYRDESVAIKVLLPEKRRDMRQINTFLSEIKMMAAVEHPYIVRFIGVAWDALSDLCAVSEFMRGGDLFALLRRFDRVEHRVQGFDIDKAKIALHIAQALTYLHSLDPIVLHRDLKSMNILLSDDWEAKLTDFGVSRRWTVDTMTGGVGTRRWMAPEVMMGKRYDTSADIFSFGVVLSELDSHQPPYANAIASITTELGEKVTETALMEMVAMGRVRVDFSSSAPSLVVDLGHACVNLNPRLRPSASEVHYQLQKILRRYQKYTL